MSDPLFLSVEDVEYLHSRSMARYGGTLGVRDKGGLEAAVNQPQQTHFYGRGDLFDIAAAYAFHIAEAQAFLDGNKRTAMAAALNFLEANGIPTHFDSLSLYDAMIGIARKRVSKDDLAAIFREQSRRTGPA